MAPDRVDTHLSVEEDGGLVCSVFSRTGTTWDHLYAIRIMHLKGNEFRLNNGRFRAFTLTQQSYPVIVKFDSYRWSGGRNASRMIQWLIDNEMTGMWSMKGLPVDTSCMHLQFSFEHSTTAVYFALHWR